jgi:kumamolisin
LAVRRDGAFAKGSEIIMSNRKYFHDSVTELPPQQGATATGLMIHSAEAAHGSEPMTVYFSLAILASKEQELAQRVAGGERLTPAELDAKYGLQASDTAPLKKWLASSGYQKIEEASDHTRVTATAPAATVAKTLEVELVRVTKNGITYTAARNAPSLPTDISEKVHGIVGLQPFHHVHKHRAYRNARSTAAAEAAMAGAHAANSPPYLPSALLQAFDGANLGLDGQGEGIAILIDTVPNAEDLQLFWSQAKVAGSLACVKTINVNGGSLPPPEGEESLDVEWTSGIAPAATVSVYATGSLAFGPLDAGLQRILDDAKQNPALRVVSISLGLAEPETPAAAMRTQSQIFLRLAALGVNVFVSSGDNGSNPDGTLQVEYPSSDPSVTAVGGTTLTLNPDFSIKSETAWAGSGGGRSVKFARPSWQKGNGVAAGKSRLVPDVAAAADPNTGALVVLNQKGQQIGGTSWSAPTWAGIITLVNQARVKAGKQRLPFFNPLLYPLNGSSSFRDVTSGSNGAYHANAGHDLVTGLGSPNVRSLLKALLEHA